MQSLKDHFLLAMPTLDDPNFTETVTFICDHNDEGALGVVINRPLTIQAKEIFQQLELSIDSDRLATQPVVGGGPVHQDRGFVLHRSGEFETTMETPGGIRMTMSQDILKALANGSGPDQVLIALGCAGWGAGQLEEELAANAWLSVPAEADIVFDTPFEQRWSQAAKLLGVDLSSLSIYAGHA